MLIAAVVVGTRLAAAAEQPADCRTVYAPTCLTRAATADLDQAIKTISRPYALRLMAEWALERRDWAMVERVVADPALPGRLRFRLAVRMADETGTVSDLLAETLRRLEASMAPRYPVGPRWFPADLGRRLVLVRILAHAGRRAQAEKILAPIRAELDRRGAGQPPLPAYPCFGHNPWRVNDGFLRARFARLGGQRSVAPASRLAVALAALGDLEGARRYLRSDRGSLTCAFQLRQMVRSLPGDNWIDRLSALPEWQQMPVTRAAIAALRIEKLADIGREKEARRRLRDTMVAFADQPPLVVASLLILAQRLGETELLNAWGARHGGDDMPASLMFVLAQQMLETGEPTGIGWLTPAMLRRFGNPSVRRFDRNRLGGPLSMMLAAQGRLRAAEEIALRLSGGQFTADDALKIGFFAARAADKGSVKGRAARQEAVELLRSTERRLTGLRIPPPAHWRDGLRFAFYAAMQTVAPRPSYAAKARAFLEELQTRKPYERMRRRRQMYQWLTRLGIDRFPIDPPAETKKD